MPVILLRRPQVQAVPVLTAPTFFGRVVVPADSGSATGTTVTLPPPPAMIRGDLVILLGLVSDDSSPEINMTQTGGQTWADFDGTALHITGVASRRWSCQFNGSWSASPVLTHTGLVTDTITGAMFIFRSSSQGIGWAGDKDADTFLTDSLAPFDMTFPSQAVQENNEVVFGYWVGSTLHQMALQTAGWTNPNGETQWRNDAADDILLSVAYKIQNAGVSGDVTNRASTGPVAQLVGQLSFYELTKQSPKVVKSQAKHRASRW